MHATEAEPDSFAWGYTVVLRAGRALPSDGRAVTSASPSRPMRAALAKRPAPGLTVSSTPRGSFARATRVAYDALHGVWLIARSASRTTSRRCSSAARPTACTGAHRSSPGGSRTAATASCTTRSGSPATTTCSSPFRGHCYLSYSDSRLRLATQTSTTAATGRKRRVADTRAARDPGRLRPAPQPVALPNGVASCRSRRRDRGRALDRRRCHLLCLRRWSRRRASATAGVAPFPSRGRRRRERDDGVARLRPSPECSGNDLLFSKSTDGLTWDAADDDPSWSGRSSSPAWPPIRLARGASRSRATPSHAGSSTSASRARSTAAQRGRGRSSDAGAHALRPDRVQQRRHGRRLHLDLVRGRARGRGVRPRAVEARGRLRQGTYAASLAVP